MALNFIIKQRIKHFLKYQRNAIQIAKGFNYNLYLIMDRFDKIKPLSGGARIPEKNLPALKSSALMAKTIISLSKVDFDSRNINRNRAFRTTSMVEKDIQRSQSGLAVRKNRSPTEHRNHGSSKRAYYEGGNNSLKTVLREAKEQEPPVQNMMTIDKAKVSSKSYGIVKAYSANSHPGPSLSYNEDRICIVTNLTKTNIRQKQISFFGIYDGKDGVAKADYMRDNFHICLAQDEYFLKDMENAMRRTLRKLSAAFCQDQRYNGDESTVGFVILVIYNQQVHYLQCNTCQAVFSSSLGEKLFFPAGNQSATQMSQKKNKSAGDLIKRGRWRELSQVDYRKYKQSDKLDFVLLGSEGLFQNMKTKEIGRRFWLYLLKNKYASAHYALGQVNNLLISDVFTSLGNKNTSIIIVAFDEVLKCLQNERKDELILPYSPSDVMTQ